VTRTAHWIAALVCTLTVAVGASAQPSTGSLEGRVADSSGAVLPGVVVELLPRTPNARLVAYATTDIDGTFRLNALAPGDYSVRFVLSGFAPTEVEVRIDAGVTATATAALAVGGLAETVQVSALAATLDVATATQTASVPAEVLTALPTASRNDTHIIVAEAGVSAPLPDRTGKGMNLATVPGAQSEDASQSLNPSVNGARPTNNARP
jgi:hypothetical protein